MDWVQTIAATKPVDKSKVDPDWTCIFEGFKVPVVQLWVCNVDLKDDFQLTAEEVFGENLVQIVRMGSGPEIVYTE